MLTLEREKGGFSLILNLNEFGLAERSFNSVKSSWKSLAKSTARKGPTAWHLRCWRKHFPPLPTRTAVRLMHPTPAMQQQVTARMILRKVIRCSSSSQSAKKASGLAAYRPSSSSERETLQSKKYRGEWVFEQLVFRMNDGPEEKKDVVDEQWQQYQPFTISFSSPPTEAWWRLYQHNCALSLKVYLKIFLPNRYIDYGERLSESSSAMEAIFARKKRLIPRSTDLSYYNWETQTCTSNPTANFEVIAENGMGLLFRNIHDRKIINVDPKTSPGDNSTRTEITTPECFQCVIYDHINRRRA